jgi:quinol monooxygenase YgiN
MYTIYVVFKCKENARESFVQRVKNDGILESVLAEDGCLRYDYYFSDKDQNELLLIEEWESKAHQQAHIDTPHMALLRTFKDEYIVSTDLGEFKVL